MKSFPLALCGLAHYGHRWCFWSPCGHRPAAETFRTKMIWAIGSAATHAAGLREMFVSMGKAFPGRSAQSGDVAALLAKDGVTAGERGIEGPREFTSVQAAAYDLSKVMAVLGTDGELRANTYKPFPCGIVNHPTDDVAIQLHHEFHIDPKP